MQGTTTWGRVVITYSVEPPAGPKIFSVFENHIRSAIAALNKREPDLLVIWPKEVDGIEMIWYWGPADGTAWVHIRVNSSTDGKTICSCEHSVHTPEVRGTVNPYIDLFRTIAVQMGEAYGRWMLINKRRREKFIVISLASNFR